MQNSYESLRAIISESLIPKSKPTRNKWPARSLVGPDGQPASFHVAQNFAYDSPARITALIAGTQGGKTAFGPWHLHREIYGENTVFEGRGQGDYLVATSTFDLFKLKLLPTFLEVFEHILELGRYWAKDKVFELKDPRSGLFWARRSDDLMWGRVILRSAQADGGLESATAKFAWLDEAGQDEFPIQAYRALRRRLALNRGRLLLTTTLYNLGWVKTEIIDKAVDGGQVAVDEMPSGAVVEVTDNVERSIRLIQYDSILNPAYPKEEYEEARESLPEDEFQMQYRGRATKLRGTIYDVFDERQNTCPRFPIPADWKHILGLDFGGVHMAGVFLAEEPLSGRLFAYREYLEGGLTVEEHARKLLEGEVRPWAYGGAKSEDQWRLQFQTAGLPVMLPEVSDVEVGILRVYEQVKKRQLIIFNDLHGLIDQFGRYRRKRGKDGEPTEEIEAKATFHLLDCVRYSVGSVRGSGGWVQGMSK